MQHIVKQIKAVTKKYKTKSGEKESVSKRVDIGVTDLFEVDEYVAIISKPNFDEIDKTIADKDSTISNLNGSVDKYKADNDSKINKIGELSTEIKALKKRVAELESDISAKDDKIGSLENDVADKDKKLKELDDVNAAVGNLKELLLDKDSTINELDKQIAVYDAIDISDLQDKAKELEKSKNAVILQQKQITECISLIGYHKERATAYKNQGVISKALGKDAATDITTPTLYLIDSSGNPIKKNDIDESVDDDAADKNDNYDAKLDVNSSGDDVKLI